jgi:hypothetical protein
MSAADSETSPMETDILEPISNLSQKKEKFSLLLLRISLRQQNLIIQTHQIRSAWSLG